METKKYNFTNPAGEVIQIDLERWIWGVVFKDGTEMHQFTDEGVFHQIGEVDQSQVTMFTLYQPEGMGDGRIDFIVPVDEETGELKEVSLIHKYRNIVFDAATPEEKRHRIYIFGWKLKGQTPIYNFVLPNDTIVQSTDQNPKISEIVQK